MLSKKKEEISISFFVVMLWNVYYKCTGNTCNAIYYETIKMHIFFLGGGCHYVAN